MSRIHEALKKAAQERSAQSSVGADPNHAAVEAVIQSPALSARQMTEPAVRDVLASDGTSFLRFDDLVKRCAHPEWRPGPRSSWFHLADNVKIGAERFRTLRSRLYQIAAARPLRRVMVTSSVPAEGKTFVAANLAHSIARQPDRRVLLIDADLRAPRLHSTLGAPSAPGLTDYLRGEADKYAVIQQGPEENLCFIPCGRDVSNPSELLLSDQMKELLELVTPMFDWVILDSPPALLVHDSSSLADLCDGVLFVVKAGSTSYETAEKACAEFRREKVLGVVLNHAEKSLGYGGYYYDYPTEEEIAPT
jgi:protein-tyrosine kinase